MEEKMSKEIINGRIVNLEKMTVEELKKLRETLKKEEKAILDEIDKELEQ